MDPALIATTLLARGVTEWASTSLSEALKGLFERSTQAKKDFQLKEALERWDPESPVERFRRRLIADLSAVQNDVSMNVSDHSFLIKVLPILLEQMIQVYEAQTDQDLRLVEMNLGQVKGYLEQYRKMMRRRASARWTAVAVSVAALVGLGTLIFFGMRPGGPSAATVLPIIQIPLSVLLWSAIGSFTAILYRFNSSGDVELQDPLRWLFTRPLTGIVMGMVAYIVVKLGFLTARSPDSSSIDSPELLWLIAFLSGFSDRFADGLLRSLVGRFGGDTKGRLVSLDEVSMSDQLSPLASLLEGLPVFRTYKRRISGESAQEADTQDADGEKEPVRETPILEEIPDEEKEVAVESEQDTSDSLEPSAAA